MQLTNFARLISLATLAVSVYAASIGTSTGDTKATDDPADVSLVTEALSPAGSYVDVEMLDPTASNGTVNVKVPLAGFSKDLYSSLVSGAKNAPSSAACIPKGEFCTWGYWDCCGSAGCLLVGINLIHIEGGRGLRLAVKLTELYDFF
ncbi:hypothetical protein EV359DRAFT_67649 [Lentinula novae-zelandiae]|nr:hypothetical protein EV359DRAFT_67649 [Lentinula novae-zelandiae]